MPKMLNVVYQMRQRGTRPQAYEVNGRLLWKASEVTARIESKATTSALRF
jgi:hypothetical protein